ncbi:DNA recombination protein RmuC [Croceibacterium atlanticum]|uniref:DNA recombination protein RmuC homolog n=1 Tax=Croceibacterium atlanticum TaxID=1267766 RepID=A0A0F7KS06_9SPHN|nr:DNA recombination protein RmuC [Croceibacterium atlanticum]AKH42052.1 DNA recombination protein RmuC [Croceibacterium atlanticum]
MDPVYAAFLIAALLAGAALGWFFGTRPLADLRHRLSRAEDEVKELDAKYLRSFADLEAARERAGRVDELSAQLETVRAERERLGSELATLKANAANFEEQKRLLVEAREELLKEFQLTGSKVLGKAQEEFLKNASERFGNAEKANKEAVAALLKPVDERLRNYERQVNELEAKRVDAFGQLTGLIQSMREGQEQVRAEAMKLGSALTNAPKARGRWGEQQLKNLLESCGLSQHTDFLLEHSIETEEGRLRPDAIVRIPGGKVLVIDAKVSLNAYQEAFGAENEEARDAALAAHVRSMKTHIQQLGAKSYQSQFEDAPDYVVMFVPGEHFVAAALEHDPGLWDFAFEKRVLLATPTNLVAIARTVAQVWRQDALAQEARAIGQLATDLYDRIAIAGDHLKRVGSGLETAVTNYNKFVGSYERNVLSSARKLRDKGIETGKREADEVQLVESAPRYTAADMEEPQAPHLVESGDR